MEFINYLKRNKYSSETLKTYKSILKTYLPYMHNIALIKKRLSSTFNEPNTTWTHYNVLVSFFKFTNDKRLLKLKEIKIPPIGIKYMPVLSKVKIYNKTNDLNDPRRSLIRFLFDTGLRVSELKEIIEIKERTLIVKGKGSKVREIIHNPQTTRWLQKISVTPKTIRIWVKEILGEEFTPHSLRRSHATHMLLKGANPKTVMLQLGHSKIETTLRYLHMNLGTNIKIYDKYF